MVAINSATTSSGVNLDNYNGVKTVAGDGKLISVVKHLPGFPAMLRVGNNYHNVRSDK